MVLTSEASLEKNERYIVIWLSVPHGTFDFDLQSLIYFPLNYTIGQQPAAATAGQHCALWWPPIFVGHCHQPSCEELWSLPALCSRLRKLICLLHLHIGRIIEKKKYFCYCLTIYWFLLVPESLARQPWNQMQLHEIHHWFNRTLISFWELPIDKDNICKCHVEIPKITRLQSLLLTRARVSTIPYFLWLSIFYLKTLPVNMMVKRFYI